VSLHGELPGLLRLNTANAYGHRPLVNNDPAKPDVKDGPANDYWDHVDYIVDKANSLGLFVGFLVGLDGEWRIHAESRASLRQRQRVHQS
jgi:hypothetical protein